MKPFIYIAAICCLLLLFGCQEAPAIEVAEATAVPTGTAAATETAVPTSTPTATAAPTETATPTDTVTPEPTATNTATPTNEPTATPTETATAAVPATATTAPPPAVAPPPAPAPSGPNLLVNPGFEFGGDGWGRGGGNYHTVDSQPQFVRSGQQSRFFVYGGRSWQQVSTGITAGTTYRAGGWLKIWSSTKEDRTVSVNPVTYLGRICINTNGDDDPNLPTTICSSWVRPLDVWQFISIDAVATNDLISVILQVGVNTDMETHHEAMWDDIYLGLAPIAATATPLPPSGPVRPNPIAFNPTSLRDTMTTVRSAIEQAGGLLDRLFNGEPGTCTEYQGYYDDAIRSAIYSGVPDDWAGIYNDTIFAVENFLATNESINALCDDGGGVLSALNYGAARTGINDSLNRLIPAIEAANAKLGG